MYDNTVMKRQQGQPDSSSASTSASMQPYIPHIGAGDMTYPITPKQFVKFHAHRGGFHSKEEVEQPPSTDYIVRASDVLEASALKGFSVNES